MENKYEKKMELLLRLKKAFLSCLNGKTTKEQYNKEYDDVIKIAEQYKIPHSNGRREDTRCHFDFHKDIYSKTIAESEAFKRYFVNVCKAKGIDIEITKLNLEGCEGFPTLEADDSPDYRVFLRSKDFAYTVDIDAKTTRFYNFICIKKNNIESYSKQKAAILLVARDSVFFISRILIKDMASIKGKTHYNPYDRKTPLFGGKPCVEISNRREADMNLDYLLSHKRIEKWKKKDKNPNWTGPLKQLNGQ